MVDPGIRVIEQNQRRADANQSVQNALAQNELTNSDFSLFNIIFTYAREATPPLEELIKDVQKHCVKRRQYIESAIQQFDKEIQLPPKYLAILRTHFLEAV